MMAKWRIQFRQFFNGQQSQCTTEVEATDVRDALRKFDAISYVNATVNAVFRPRWDRSDDFRSNE